ncbi:MAG TPA: pyridoxamine 5'-phosphate oxidase family protein [Gammaproteobacteria bacterium]|nr:pyridoxamine 5'-phosphate oxidase family protein [Gammaproteobacteria bacterium]
MDDDDSQLLQTLLLTFDRAMLVSRCGDAMRARPTTLAHTRDTRRIWLLCGILGDGLHDIDADPNVSVVLQDGCRFCSVSGTARVVRHASETVQSATRRGRVLLTLIEVTPRFAEYWDRSGGKGVKLEAEQPAKRDAPGGAGPADGARRYDNVIPLERARWRK